MKFAAFISIIVSAAVMFVACQGAVGPAGEQGPKGDTGDSGAAGPQGPAGPGAFQARSGVDAVLLNDAELVDDDDRAIDDDAETAVGPTTKKFTLNLGDYFVGGAGGNTYALVDADPATPAIIDFMAGSAVITAEVSDGTLEYTLTMPTGGFPDETRYTTGYTGMVTATDANGVSANAAVNIRLNRAPTFEDSDNDGIVTTTPLLLGTADEDRGTALPAVPNFYRECKSINSCVLAVFSDDDELTISVKGMTQEGKADTTKVGWSTTPSGAIELFGIASTWLAPDGGTANHRSITVTLEAEDTKGLTAEAKVLVNVDSAPTLTTLGQSYVGTTQDVDGQLVVTTDATGWFQDTETTGTPTYSGKTGNDDIAVIDGLVNGALPSGNGVTITAVALGQSTAITITATDGSGLGQTATVEFTANVTGVSS
ncbi:MAG: collagen-like protein [Spirochaetaceae bacterium]|nr:collagen-like protein [Spirochaetaceae bacterium]